METQAGGQSTQLFVLDEDEEVIAEPDEDPKGEEVRVTRRPKKKVGRKPLPDHLPRIDKVIDLDPEEKVCCGQEMTHIGNDEREVLECVPAVFYVMRFLVRKYTCSICHGEQGCHGSVATADMPPRILPGSSAGNSMVAEVVANKMADGLPGYRQGKRFERFGLSVSQRTITNWLLNVAKKAHVMDKILLQEALSRGAIQLDETTCQVFHGDRCIQPGRH